MVFAYREKLLKILIMNANLEIISNLNTQLPDEYKLENN